MEPKSLERLLDCPICFERLDGSNRVLPCQHTFCKKCLERVKVEFKELRCPECRKKYTGYINDLPCNVLVMRILEQIRQSEKETQKLKNINNQIKHSNNKIESKSQFQNNEKRNCLNNCGSSSTTRDNISQSTFRNNSETSGIFVRNRGPAIITTTQQPPSNNNGNVSAGNRLIIGAVRKQNRNREDGSRVSSMFVRSFLPSSAPHMETVVQTPQGNDRFTFSLNAYSFAVELKPSDHNSNAARRLNKNYVKPSVLNTVSNQNVIRIQENIFDTNVTNVNPIAPSTSQSIASSQNAQKNYLSFSPNSYSFNVDLRPTTDRSKHQKKNYLS